MSEEQEMQLARVVFKVICLVFVVLFALGAGWAMSNGTVAPAMAYAILMIFATIIGSLSGNG